MILKKQKQRLHRIRLSGIVWPFRFRMRFVCRGVAQWLACSLGVREVGGSIPLAPTSKIFALRKFWSS